MKLSCVLLLTACFLCWVPGAQWGQSAGAALLPAAQAVNVPSEGPWSAPLPSPDGRYVAFTDRSFKGLYLLDVASGVVLTISDLSGTGFRPTWSPDSRSLAFRASLEGARGKCLIVVAHPDGAKESASPLLDSVSLPFWRGLELCYFLTNRDTPDLRRLGSSAGSAADPRRLPVAEPSGRLMLVSPDAKIFEAAAAPGKTFFLPVLSEDGARFVVECLDGHLYLGSTDGGLLKDLGAVAQLREGRTALLFERTTDDGHVITGGDLFLMDLATLDVTPVTDTRDRVERHPALAGDGHTLYFDADGTIYKGWMP